MCGFVGFTGALEQDARVNIVEKMMARIVHRGPDMGSHYAGSGVTLGFRRLSIIDLRETANHLVDTSELKTSALQAKLREIVMQAGQEPNLRVELLSFGFKRGIPRDGDLVPRDHVPLLRPRRIVPEREGDVEEHGDSAPRVEAEGAQPGARRFCSRSHGTMLV